MALGAPCFTHMLLRATSMSSFVFAFRPIEVDTVSVSVVPDADTLSVDADSSFPSLTLLRVRDVCW